MGGKRHYVDEIITSVLDRPVTPGEDGGPRLERVRTRYRVTDKGVFEVKVERIQNIVRTTKEGKTYSYWRDAEIIIYVDRGDGSCLRQRFGNTEPIGKRQWRSDLVFADSPDVAAVPPCIRVGLVDKRDYYAIVPIEAQDAMWMFPTQFVRHFGACDSVRELTIRLFGKTRVRRDLVKAVASLLLERSECSLVMIYLAWQFRGLVPIDWIVDFLRRGSDSYTVRSVYDYSGCHIIRPVLRHFDQCSLRRLLATNQEWHALAERNLPRGIDIPTRIESAHDLHDRMWREYRQRLQAEQVARDIERLESKREDIDKIAAKLDGITDAGLRVVTATHPNQLVEWGNIMDNCIGGYGSRLGTNAYLGVYDGERLVANVEVRHALDDDSTLTQLLGKHNGILDEPVYDDMLAYLSGHGINCDVPFWGLRTPETMEAVA